MDEYFCWKGKLLADLSREELIEALMWYATRWTEMNAPERLRDSARGRAARFMEMG
jgi:hypothetical protein